MMDPGYFHAAITVISGLILAGAAHLVIRRLEKKADATDTQLDNIILNAIGGPLVVAIIAVSIYAALTRFDVVPDSLTGSSRIRSLPPYSSCLAPGLLRASPITSSVPTARSLQKRPVPTSTTGSSRS